MGYRNKFIKVFVNEMYAILIGIGIGNVLFASEFDFQDILSVISLLFVTSIVLTYWWDWTEYAEGEVSNSKGEMVLDFAILITLEMLFAYYSSMYSIAYILLAIASLDLLWVLNRFYETKMYKGDKRQQKRTVTWLIEKFIGISVYIILIYSIRLTNTYILESIARYITLGEVMLAFVIVRKLSFNQIHKVSITTIQLANLTHVAEVLAINHSYFIGENQGLLLKKYTQLEIVNIIQENRLYVAVDFENIVLGYCSIVYSMEKEILDATQPIIIHKYNRLKENAMVYIEQIAVMKNLEKNGIASSILGHIVDVHPKKIFASYVASEPFENTGSIKFHLNNGFVKTGIFTRSHFAGRDNYLSFLFVKEH